MKRFVVAAGLLGLAACQGAGGEAGSYTAAQSAQQPLSEQSADDAQEHDMQSKASRRADGTIVQRSESNSAEVSTDHEAATPFPDGVVAATAPDEQNSTNAQPLVKLDDLTGKWTVYLQDDDRVCDLTLDTEKKDDGYAATFNNCMNGDLFFVSSWRMKGQELVLFDNFSRAKASMRMSERNRWEGQIASAQPITIAR